MGRVSHGLAVAGAKGRIGGRRPKFSEQQWQEMERLLADGECRQQVAIAYNVGVSTLYKKFPAKN